jgi:hypothetical protein
MTLPSRIPTATVVFASQGCTRVDIAVAEMHRRTLHPGRLQPLVCGAPLKFAGVWGQWKESSVSDRSRSNPRVAGDGAPESRDTTPRDVTPRGPAPRDRTPTPREQLVQQRAQFGGFKFGSAFFGWLTATGTAVILTAVVAASGAAVGLGSRVSDLADGTPSEEAAAMGWVGAIALLVILFVSYFVGGYVAGRMARFDGAKQGLAVWLWAILVAIVVAGVAVIAGSQFNVLAQVNSFPRIPVDEGDITAATAITAVLLAVISLVGAVLGGLAGMRFHRRVDRVSAATSTSGGSHPSR